MQDNKSIEIASRFWLAFDYLRRQHGRGWQSEFIRDAGTNIGNFLRLKREPWREFELKYLAMLVDRGVDAGWLLTGKGEMDAIVPVDVPVKNKKPRQSSDSRGRLCPEQDALNDWRLW